MKAGSVVIVEDSPTVALFLKQLVEEIGFEVAGIADNGITGEQLILEKKPTIVLSDIRMPGVDGIEMTRSLMRSFPVPVVLITAHDPGNPEIVFKAMQAGALEVLPKPPAPGDSQFEPYKQRFEVVLRTLSGVPLLRKIEAATRETKKIELNGNRLGPPVIAIGASTGGPTLVPDLLCSLPPNSFSFVVIALHMAHMFAADHCDWLRATVPFPVQFAKNGEPPCKGVVYLAPPRFHLKYEPDGTWTIVKVTGMKSPHTPSIDFLFESLVSVNQARVVAILLTGIGTDGALGLRKLSHAGAITIVQEPESALVGEMPEAAIRLQAASWVLTPAEMRAWLSRCGDL